MIKFKDYVELCENADMQIMQLQSKKTNLVQQRDVLVNPTKRKILMLDKQLVQLTSLKGDQRQGSEQRITHLTLEKSKLSMKVQQIEMRYNRQIQQLDGRLASLSKNATQKVDIGNNDGSQQVGRV